MTQSERMRRIAILFLASVAGMCCTGSTWAGDDASRMFLKVQLDGVAIAETEFVSAFESAAPVAKEPLKRLSFSFRPQRRMLWMSPKGVTVLPIQTKPLQVIAGAITIWPAEAHSGRITIGATFYDEDKILLRITHIAHPNKRDQSEVATGLVISTRPAMRAK